MCRSHSKQDQSNVVGLTEETVGGRAEGGASVDVEAKSVGLAGDPHYQSRSLAVGYRHPPQVNHHSTHPEVCFYSFSVQVDRLHCTIHQAV